MEETVLMAPMKAFISHNKANKNVARALAEALLTQGIEPWFDEWSIRPGESIVEGFELGMTTSEVFIMLWTREAVASNWVGTEMRAFIRRRVDDKTLRVIPITLDETPLPVLIAEYKGFSLKSGSEVVQVAFDIAEGPTRENQISCIHQLLIDKLYEGKPLIARPLAIFCEKCYSTNHATWHLRG